MKKYRITDFTDLLDKPGGAPKLQLFPNMILDGTGNVSGDFVEVHAGAQTGWLAKGTYEEADRLQLNEVAFVRECIIAERSFNALDQTKPWFVLADYLIARALIETRPKLENAGNKLDGSDAVGPMQVSSVEWQKFLDSDCPLKEGFEKGDFDDYLMQVWGAAYTMFADAKAITQVRLDAGTGSEADPPLPSYLEIYIAYLTGSAKAAVALSDAAATAADTGQASAGGATTTNPDSGTKLNQFLKSKQLLTDDQIATLFKTRAKFTGTNDGNAKTVGDFVQAVTTELNTALKEAFALIQKDAPETIPPVGQGGAPWLDVAEKEKAKDIKEGNSAGDARILEYFKSINFQTTTSKTPWCAAFVSFCMKTSGNPTAAASVPKSDPALAATWKGWGAPLALNSSATPQGAVVVLTPTENSDSSGHVGFFSDGDTNNVTLLGGNQSNAVKESTYARSRIAAIRWLDVAQVAAGPGGSAKINLAGLSAQQQAMAKLIVDKFAAAGFGKLQQIAAVANAKRESSLNPSERTTTAKEDSIGLFQLNMKGGVGRGHSVPDLLDPAKNTDIIIAEARKFPSFGRATTLEGAVREFVVWIERPANTDAEVAKRLEFANALMA
jgi:uncharacterized protein (TIGR02594 family)